MEIKNEFTVNGNTNVWLKKQNNEHVTDPVHASLKPINIR